MGNSSNIFTGISNNLFGNDSFLGGVFNKVNINPYESDKEIKGKLIDNKIYQRFCLFVYGNQMLEVLKIRKKHRNSFC